METAEVIQLGVAPKGNKNWESVPGYPYLRRHRTSRIYHIRFSKAGRGRLEKSTGQDLVGKANSVALEMIAEFLGEKKKTAGRRQYVSSVADELLEELIHEHEIGKRRLRTFEKDRTMIPIVKNHFGHFYIDELDEDFWNDWSRQYQRRVLKERMAGRDPGRTTLFDVSKYLSKLLTFAERKKYVLRRPRFKNPDPAQPQTTPKIYTLEELKRIRSNFSEDVLLGYVLAQECCFRLSEAICLQWDMVTFTTDDIGNGIAIVRLPNWLVKTGSTTGEGREVEVSDLAYELLSKIRDQNGGKSIYVFPSPKDPNKPLTRMTMWRRWNEAKRKAGITGKAWFHHLRATFYTKKLLDERIDVTSVSAYGGTSITTLQKRYLKADAKRTRHVVKS